MKTLALTLVALFFIPLATRAQTAATPSPSPTPSPTPTRQQTPVGGSYVTYVGEQMAGEETFALARSADGATVTATGEVGLGGSKSKTTTVAAKGRPVSFTVEMGASKVVEATFASGAAKVQIAGQAPKEVKTNAAAVIENGVWHHFIFLLEQYDASRGGKQSFTAFLPSQSAEFALEVERVGTPTVTAKGESVALEHFRATTSQNLVFELWADPATRAPLFLRIPAQNVRVVRKGWEWLPDAVAPKAATTAPASDHFTSEEVEFRNGDVTLAATLTVPKRGTAPFPAAVIITGSGGQDRDGTAVFNLYRLVAETLSEAGVAVLRADDRGVGGSRMTQMRAPSYTDLVSDTRAAVDYLLTRADIDKTRVALVGHSEGAQTALVIAADDPRVAAVALLAGTSRPLDRVVSEQALYMVALQEAVDPADRGRLPQLARGIMDFFDEAKRQPKPAAGEDRLAWFREHAASDPVALAARVRVPALILNGERDANVLAHHAVELAEAMARAGNKQVRLRIFPNLSHMFTPSTLDLSVKPDAAAVVDKGFLETLRRWAEEFLVRK